MANSQKKTVEQKPAAEDFWWLLNTCNPDKTPNPTVIAISNIYCLADFMGKKLDVVEQKIGAKQGQLKKILDETEKTWNDNSVPLSQKKLPEIPEELVENASKFFYVTPETLTTTPLSPDFYYYTFGQPTSLNVREANNENMKLVLFIEKLALDVINYVFNIASFQDGDVNHFGAKYELVNVENKEYTFKVQRDAKSGTIIIMIDNMVGGTLVFEQGDVAYPIANRMEHVLHSAAVRDAQCKKVTTIPKDVFNIMDSFLSNSAKAKVDIPEYTGLNPVPDKKEEEREVQVKLPVYEEAKLENEEIFFGKKSEDYYLDEDDKEEDKEESDDGENTEEPAPEETKNGRSVG